MNLSRRSLLLSGAGAVALGAGLPRPANTVSARTAAGTGFVRRDAATMIDARTGAWDPALYWYAKAVGWMMEQPVTAWNSYLFQANIHRRPVTSEAVQDVPEWNQCPHASLYFLPWHRWYVYYFERIVRHIIVNRFGRTDQANWALPYWNYAHVEPSGNPLDSEEWRRIPLAFRQRYLPGEGLEPNPLYLPPGDLSGRLLLDGQSLTWVEASPDAAMATNTYSVFSLALETAPHTVVHARVGGRMGAVGTAARDPLFWLHHANIDRFWAAWSQGAQDPFPSGLTWPEQRLDSPHPFVLRDENGQQQVLSGDAFAFPADAYQYDSLTDGTGTGLVPLALPVSAPSPGSDTVASAPETLLGPGTTMVRLLPRTDDIGGVIRGELEDGRVILTISGMRAHHQPRTTFQVFLGDDVTDNDPEGPAFVTVLNFFGATGEQHHGHGDAHGNTVHFDVTDNLRRLLADREWSGQGAPAVRIAPITPTLDPLSDPRIAEISLTVP